MYGYISQQKIIRWLSLICLISLVSSCEYKEKQTTIAVLYNQTSNPGSSLRLTAELIEQELKTKKEYQDLGINLLISEIGATQESALKVFHRIVKEHSVDLIIGPTTSHQSIPISRAANSLKIPMISPSASNTEVTRNKPYVFTGVFSSEAQSKALADFVALSLKVNNVGIIYDASNTYNKKMALEFKKILNEYPSVDVYSYSYVKGNLDVRNYLVQMKEKDVELLFLPNFDKDLEFQTALISELDWRPIILGSDAFYPNNYLSRPIVSKTYFAHQWGLSVAKENIRAKKFINEFHNQFKSDPTIISALSYDAFKVGLEAIRRSYKNKQTIHSQLKSIKDLEGVSGNYSFINSNVPEKPVFIFEIIDGEAVLYEEKSNE